MTFGRFTLAGTVPRVPAMPPGSLVAVAGGSIVGAILRDRALRVNHRPFRGVLTTASAVCGAHGQSLGNPNASRLTVMVCHG